jgi:hypothetical protein
VTAVAVNCPNGHQNPPHQHFCGECGALLPMSCPNGHQNPPHQHFCSECGTPLQQVHEDWFGKSGPKLVRRYLPTSTTGMATPYKRDPHLIARPTSPPQPTPRRNYAKVAALLTTGLLAMLLVVIAIGVGVHHNATTDSGSTASTSVTMPSTSDQWFAAVCKSGTFRDGGGNGQWLWRVPTE